MAVSPRLSLNQATVRGHAIDEVARACGRAGVRYVGVRREAFEKYAPREVANLLAENGIGPSSLCRAGFVTSADPARRAAALDEARWALDEAAELGAPVLVFVAGGLDVGSRDLDGARRRVADALHELVPHALDTGVRLGVEPLHPLFCSDRSVVVTLGQAAELARPHPRQAVGVVVDAYATWWDPSLAESLCDARERICAFQVDDFALPLPPEHLNGRALMGEGCIDLRLLASRVAAAGYTGPVEVEVFDEELRRQPVDAIVGRVVDSWRSVFGDVCGDGFGDG
jgi:sugar phosphate isomerase/epimerase